MLHALLFGVDTKLREASRGVRATLLLPLPNAYWYKPDAELMVSGELILMLCALCASVQSRRRITPTTRPLISTLSGLV